MHVNMIKVKKINIDKISVGGDNGIAVIAGPCVIESETSALRHAELLKKITAECKINFIYKSSFDKANRSSIDSYRGPGIGKGLKILARIKKELRVPVLSDIHSADQAERAGEVLDVIQIPAFLCRQTDILVAAAKTGRCVNVKKGQFMAPWDMKNAVNKIRSSGCDRIIVTDRGVSFGYNNLVSDMRAIPIMREMGYPVCYDATHSVQIPGGLGTKSGGDAKYVPYLAKAAAICGADIIFLEVHQDPQQALSDGPNSIKISELKALLLDIKEASKIAEGRSKNRNRI